ncbi:MAG: hypothetical protein GDA67_08140 [Nitrospira sp. CR1.3]|nr:hypothetical protein [Nitrospira sp. CR1.3]
MTQLAQKLDKKLASWRPEVAAQVEQIITDVIELADTDTLDLQPSRTVVQEVLDTLDERQGHETPEALHRKFTISPIVTPH